MRKDFPQWLALAGFILLSFAVASLGSWFTGMSLGDWYGQLKKPSWTPPGSVIGPVWTVLYIMMAVSAWLVWRVTGFRGGAPSLGLYGLQLVLNASWSGAFFALRSPAAGLAVIMALWWAVLATLLLFWKVKPLAGMLLVPYLLWVTFAAGLNYVIWHLNA